MPRSFALRIILMIAFMLLYVNGSMASSMIFVTSGTISYSGVRFGDIAYTNFDLAGIDFLSMQPVTITGTNNAADVDPRFSFPFAPLPYTADPSVGFFAGSIYGPFSLKLQTPNSVTYLTDNGECCLNVNGSITAAQFAVTRKDPFTYYEGFSLSLEVDDYRLNNDYLFIGNGMAALQFDQGFFQGATYTFLTSTVPEPSTGLCCLMALFGGVGMALVSARRAHFRHATPMSTTTPAAF
jgi:hypothetical protein